jgi:hypothetical protein
MIVQFSKHVRGKERAMLNKVAVRKTVSSRIYAKATYPKLDSPKATTSVYLNVMFTDDEALNLARHLIQASREAMELTIKVIRKPARKTGLHNVSVTYETRAIKSSNKRNEW